MCSVKASRISSKPACASSNTIAQGLRWWLGRRGFCSQPRPSFRSYARCQVQRQGQTRSVSPSGALFQSFDNKPDTDVILLEMPIEGNGVSYLDLTLASL